MDAATWARERGGVVRSDRIGRAGYGRGALAPTATAVVHWARPVVPRHPDGLVDAPENVLAAVAACQPFEVALAVWESALRNAEMDAAALARLRLPACARRVLAAAEVWSDSGLETFVVPRLRWMRLPLRRQIWIAGHRVDLLIGERLVLQIDGGHHVGPQRLHRAR
ncbi:DNA/RNA helicase [Microbacterium hominis]|uniref:DNA/RNA helicase n=1 Tax=Microbacterium TaxID=33882 RepID=UPI00168AD569|nr:MULTISPECIES: DNA/RNA helicase [Microbacterium]QOC24538.1 DNA/RNA helicase [Microbacterium hominis]QOC28608.1 DNA/RNA helicase [Microbacterium hominis]QYF99163.1 DNA/RNA helicase [Microbacterium sp. PAMC21962]